MKRDHPGITIPQALESPPPKAIRISRVGCTVARTAIASTRAALTTMSFMKEGNLRSPGGSEREIGLGLQLCGRKKRANKGHLPFGLRGR
eukprot:6189773-Pleurochrysis_carterae.AAC.3